MEFQERCLRFGIAIVQLIEKIPPRERPTVRTKQLEKCGTSIGANVAESQSAQSRADFISKFEIALKEARETDYWLRILKETEPLLAAEAGPLIGECWQITAILVASIKTAKRNGGIHEPRLEKARAESREQN
jgi:four helix bundle protein